MKKIEKLTKSQKEKFSDYAEKWLSIGLYTGKCDREKAEDAVRRAYNVAGLEGPGSFLWFESPLSGASEAEKISKNNQSIMSQIWYQTWDQVRDQVGDQVRTQVWDQVWDQVWENAWDQAWNQVRDQVWDQVGDQVWDQVRDQVWDQVGDQLYSCGYGTQDAHWLGYYEFFKDELKMDGLDRLQPLIDLAKSGCGWWWSFEKVCVMTEPPIKMVRDEEHRLHCESGPALEYADGFSIHAWHGVRLPSWVIENKTEITGEKVLSEDNQEVRRAMLEIYGWDRFLSDLGAVEVHRDKYGTLLETSRLGEYLAGEDELARFVRVVDPSTGRNYALRVPPNISTAREAVAWTFNIEGDLYSPKQEA